MKKRRPQALCPSMGVTGTLLVQRHGVQAPDVIYKGQSARRYSRRRIRGLSVANHHYRWRPIHQPAIDALRDRTVIVQHRRGVSRSDPIGKEVAITGESIWWSE